MISATNEFGDTPLVDVALLGNDEIANILLSYGADPNASSDTLDNVLHCAIRSGNPRLVELLLEAGADPHYRTDLSETFRDALPNDETKRQGILDVLAKFRVK